MAAEYQAILESLPVINATLASEDPKSMAPALLGKELINTRDSERIALPTTIDSDAARIISNTVLKKVKAKPEKVFKDFLNFLEDSHFH